MSRTIVVLLGGPGAGKGTQARLIAERAGIPHVSTGDILRSEIVRRSPLGLHAEAIVNHGGLVDDALVNELVAGRTAQPDCRDGFVLDGYPRVLNQARALEQIFGADDRLSVVDIVTPVDSVVLRLSYRLTCGTCAAPHNTLSSPPIVPGKCDFCGGALYRRRDDNESVIRERFRAYHSQSLPLIEFYSARGVYTAVDGLQTPSRVTADTLNALNRTIFTLAC